MKDKILGYGREIINKYKETVLDSYKEKVIDSYQKVLKTDKEDNINPNNRGKNNVIYLILVPGGSSVSGTNGIAVVKKANEWLKKFELTTRVALFHGTKQDALKISKQDGIAFLGDAPFVIKYIEKFSEDFAYHLESEMVHDWLTYAKTGNPENSSNTVHLDTGNYDANYIAMDFTGCRSFAQSIFKRQQLSKVTQEEWIETTALILIHGAGHNSQSLNQREFTKKIKQFTGINSILGRRTRITELWDHYGGLMYKGKDLRDYFQNYQYEILSLNHLHRKILEDEDKDLLLATEEVKIYLKVYEIYDTLTVLDSIYQNNQQLIQTILQAGLGTTLSKYIDSLSLPLSLLKELVRQNAIEWLKEHPNIYPNRTYQLAMREHFGIHTPKVNSKIGKIYD